MAMDEDHRGHVVVELAIRDLTVTGRIAFRSQRRQFHVPARWPWGEEGAQLRRRPSSFVAAGVEDAGFWPVTSFPSTTT